MSQDATLPAVTDHTALDTVADQEAATRSRRRRNRGRGPATAEVAADAATDTTTPDTDVATNAGARAVAESVQEPLVAEALVGDAPAGSVDVSANDDAATGSSRRRRRRGRGGRGGPADVVDGNGDGSSLDEQEAISPRAAQVQVSPDMIDADTAIDADTGMAAAMPTRALSEPRRLSPAVLRRFDHRDWRDRPGRTATTTPAAAPMSTAAADDGTIAPTPFERPTRDGRDTRDRRFGERRPSFSRERTDDTPIPSAPSAPPAPLQAIPVAAPLASTATSPIVTPAAPADPIITPTTPSGQIITPDYRAAPTSPTTPAPARSSGIDERLERLLAGQQALLHQQGQAIEAMAQTMAALHGAIERMTTTGIAAGMPRAGMFVDAPNVVYAAENARVRIDYGRMLDFLGRGREMVHAIVYAPVTEDTGYRFENQRFVAPFLNKGYKLVTKPLKRFPDGTAKGNFDIELAIDIVTMSTRLDVVILISGDSDFSRLIELIQSRGVRVEVAAFASNVSWELVQMADVFIDIGQYIHEFQE